MKQTPVENMTYEDAIAELEGVIAQLEAGQASLEDSLTLFEKGQFLAKHCMNLLDKAELRVQQLSPDSSACEHDA